MSTGWEGSILPRGVKFSNSWKCPCWNSHTNAPKLTDSDSILRTTALNGTTTLPSMRKSKTNTANTIKPRAHGRLLPRLARKSVI